ncbi:MAG: hypothetical protein U0232_21650 [Thermomicrobiales bacterium]
MIAALGGATIHRLSRGHSDELLGDEDLAAFCGAGVGLVVTADIGVAAFRAPDVARTRGLKLVITDHHAPHRGADGTPPVSLSRRGRPPGGAPLGHGP